MESEKTFLYSDTVRIVDITTISLFILSGVSGNLLLIAVHFAHKTRAADMFVLNMVLFDSLGVFGMIPLLASIIMREQVLVGIPCVAWGLAWTTGVVGSLYSLTMVSVCRMVQVCYPSSYNRYFKAKRIVLYCIAIWILSLVVISPPLLGWGGYDYSKKFMFSGLDYRRSASFTLFLYIAGEFSSLILTFVCYAKIYLTVKKSNERMEAHGQQNQKKKQKGAVYTFILSAIFTLSWSPFCFLSVADTFTDVNAYAIKVSAWLGISNSVVNSWVYMFINKNYRKVLFKWRGNSVNPITTDNTNRGQGVSSNPGTKDGPQSGQLGCALKASDKNPTDMTNIQPADLEDNVQCETSTKAKNGSNQLGNWKSTDHEEKVVDPPVEVHRDSAALSGNDEEIMRKAQEQTTKDDKVKTNVDQVEDKSNLSLNAESVVQTEQNSVPTEYSTNDHTIEKATN